MKILRKKKRLKDMSTGPDDRPDEVDMIHISVVEALSVTEQETRKQTHRDPILSRVLEVVQSGWREAEAHLELIPTAKVNSGLIREL